MAKENEKKKIKVAIGMSGGVDSSVAAMLLKEQGFEVVGLFLKLWSDESCAISRENACCDEKALADARKVAAELEIPFYVVDAREKFKKDIVDYYLDEYRALRTPNPCVLCNKKIKFGWMLEFAEQIGCEKVATGHYSRIEKTDHYRLFRGKDKNKDQSYFLWQLGQEQLSKIIFPLGEMTKDRVRALAKEKNLPVYEKVESQEICFVADDYREFLKRHLPPEYFESGRIVDQKGYTVGQHEGLVNYTIGQRKGISQSASQLASESVNRQPLYVVGFNLEKNELIVGENADTSRSEMIVADAYINKFEDVKVKIRYRAEAVTCTVKSLIPNSSFLIQFETPQRAVTPGQSAVFYCGDEVVGGGIIR
ncbi:MAG: tRNA 2-thiouridine(34) synthase MnmA [Patescibacteria group bacterium]|jgi:tRNA-specific 2-thiouridylase